MMNGLARQLKALGDETRLRIFHVLAQEEVSVGELGSILNLGQSRVSSHLGVLRESFSLRERKDGRRAFLSLDAGDPATRELLELTAPRVRDSRIGRLDRENLMAAVARRKVEQTDYFDPAAGDLGRRYLPGRTWEGFARGLLRLVSVGRMADVGIGDGDMTLLLSSCAETLYAVDTSEAVLARVRRKAEAAGAGNVEFLRGEIEALPFPDGALDVVVASQILQLVRRPGAAIAECARVLAPGGRLLVLDLKSHDEAWVREKLGHRSLGFSESELEGWLGEAGLAGVAAYPVARDGKAPHFVTVLATGVRA